MLLGIIQWRILPMSGLLPNVDPDGLLEYSVVYTDRAVNHMSNRFQQAMNDIHGTLTDVYDAETAIVMPGSGTSGMEAVARQFATDKRVMVIRNGWFSYRWSQIFEMGDIPASETVLKARPVSARQNSALAPVDVDEVVAKIRAQKPEVVFAPHVETSAGLLLPDAYLKAVADAVHEHDGLFVLDCIASGTLWVDMRAIGVDVLISAPQKGWSSSPCAGLVMLSERARIAIDSTNSSSFSLDLKKWLQIMQAYLDGKHAYHATLPTDGLLAFRDVMQEMSTMGFDVAKERQQALGQQVRSLLGRAGFASVAAEGFEAPGVVVCYTDDDALHTGRAFAHEGVQIAAGVPLQIGEPAGFKTFRIGLFGIDKLADVDAAARRFASVLSTVQESRARAETA